MCLHGQRLAQERQQRTCVAIVSCSISLLCVYMRLGSYIPVKDSISKNNKTKLCS